MSDPEVSRLLNRFVDLPFSRVQAYWAASLVRGNGVSDLQVLRWYIGAQDRQHKSSRAMSRKPKNEVPRGEAIRNGRAVQSRAILDYFDEVLRQHPDVFRRDPRMGFRLLGLATRRIESPLHNVLFSLIGQSKLFEWDSPESLASMIAADVDALQRSLVDALKRSRPNAPPLNSQEDHLLAQMLLTTAYHMKKLQEGPSTGAQSPTEPSTGGAATLGLGGGGLGDFHGIKGGTLARGVVLGAALGTLAVLSAAQSMFFNEIKSAIPTNDQRVAEIIFGEALKDSDPTGAAQRLITRYRKLVEEFSRTRFTRVPPSGMTHKDVLVVQKAAPQAGEVESGLPGGLRGFVVAPWLVDWSSAPSWLSGDVVGVLVGLLLVAGVAGVAAVASVVDTQWLRAIFGRGSQPSAPVRVNVFERTLDAKHRMSISKARRHLAEVGRGVLKGSLTFKVIGEGRVAVLEDRPAASQGSTSETKETARHERGFEEPIDKEGRVLVPQEVVDQAAISRAVVLVINKEERGVEIWSHAVYKKVHPETKVEPSPRRRRRVTGRVAGILLALALAANVVAPIRGGAQTPAVPPTPALTDQTPPPAAGAASIDEAWLKEMRETLKRYSWHRLARLNAVQALKPYVQDDRVFMALLEAALDDPTLSARQA
ncbi:MAG: hypothetical protein HYY90_01135, partial [Candidatus Omnitrophica bacterium]|nr:hypothetical protein [Candidatus Omnitrophota bacterium]